MFEQYSHDDTFICFEQECHLSRIITKWEQLKLHNQFNHKVISKQKFENKINFKFNEFSQQQKIKIQEDINQLIEYKEQRIISKIQELFDFFQNRYTNIIEDQIYLDYQLSNSQSIESEIQNQIKIYYGLIQRPQQEQVAIFLDEIQIKLDLIVNEFLNLIEKNFALGNQYSNNASQQKITQCNDSTLPQTITTQPTGIQENSNQTQFIQNKSEQVKYDINYIYHETNQNIYDQNTSQSQSTLNQNQYIEEDCQNNLPLKNYKQYQQQQKQSQNIEITQVPTNNIQFDNNEGTSYESEDRMLFQLPSQIEHNQKMSYQQSDNDYTQSTYKTKAQDQTNTSKNTYQKLDNDYTLYVPKTNAQEQNNKTTNSHQKSNKDEEESIYEAKQKKQDQYQYDNHIQQNNQKNIKTTYPQNVYFGKKFDLINSQKNLNFSNNKQAFFCQRQGLGLVDGIINLQRDAEIILRFSDSQSKEYQAEIGIISVDKNGQMKGSKQYSMNELGDLISNGQVYKGKLKIILNKEYLISYSSQESMLYFISGTTEEFLDLDKAQGQFKFFVKLYGLKVLIIQS